MRMKQDVLRPRAKEDRSVTCFSAGDGVLSLSHGNQGECQRPSFHNKLQRGVRRPTLPGHIPSRKRQLHRKRGGSRRDTRLPLLQRAPHGNSPTQSHPQAHALKYHTIGELLPGPKRRGGIRCFPSYLERTEDKLINHPRWHPCFPRAESRRYCGASSPPQESRSTAKHSLSSGGWNKSIHVPGRRSPDSCRARSSPRPVAPVPSPPPPSCLR